MADPANIQYLFPDDRGLPLGKFRQTFDSQISFSMDYNGWLNAAQNENVSAVSYMVSPATAPALTVVNNIISATPGVITFQVAGGIPGTVYDLFVRTTTTLAQVKSDRMTISIQPFIAGIDDIGASVTPTSATVLAQLLGAATSAATSESNAATYASQAELAAATAVAALFSGAGAPAAALGLAGSFYVDTTNMLLYGPKNTNGWGGGVVLIGQRGNGVYNGVGAPTSGLGVAGDFYIDTAAMMLYGPRATVGWGTGVLLKGNTVYSQAGVPSSSLGVVGDIYIENSTTPPVLYGPKTGAGWGTGISL